jgi:hypothetical protein
MLHIRRPKGLGWLYKARLGGLGMCSINLVTTDFHPSCVVFRPAGQKQHTINVRHHAAAGETSRLRTP